MYCHAVTILPFVLIFHTKLKHRQTCNLENEMKSIFKTAAMMAMQGVGTSLFNKFEPPIQPYYPPQNTSLIQQAGFRMSRKSSCRMAAVAVILDAVVPLFV